MSTTIQTKDADGSVVIFRAHPPVDKPGFTIRQVDAIPEGPGKLQWDTASGAIIRYVAPPTPQQVFDAAVKAGYTVPGVTPPLVLPMDDASMDMLHKLSYQLFTMQNAGRIASTDQFPVTDIAGSPRLFSVQNLQTMIMGLGEAYLTLWSALHAATVG